MGITTSECLVEKVDRITRGCRQEEKDVINELIFAYLSAVQMGLQCEIAIHRMTKELECT